MCGIAGAYVYDDSADLRTLVAIVEAASTRGVDAFGVVRWTAREGYSRTNGARGWLGAIGEPAGPTIYLHTSRAEPTTEWGKQRTPDDIPPFVEANIAVAHNGIVANDEALRREYEIDPQSSIDTAVVPHLVSRYGPWGAMSRIVGGCALAMVCPEVGHLVLCRNFMPLVVVWEPGIALFASELSMFPGAEYPLGVWSWELPAWSAVVLSSEAISGPHQWGVKPRVMLWRGYPQVAG